MIVDIGKKCFGIADGLILSNNYRVMALDYCSKCVQNGVLLNIFRTNGQTFIKFCVITYITKI